MLERQIHLYSVDTGHFYSSREAYLHRMNHRCRRERTFLAALLPELEKELREQGLSDTQFRRLKKDWNVTLPEPQNNLPELIKYRRTLELIAHKRQKAQEYKDKLRNLLTRKTAANECSQGRNHVRTLPVKRLKDSDIISVFESFLTRTLGLETDQLAQELVVVQVYYFELFKDLCYYGFTFCGQHYRYLTSSAGQIRTKKAVFIQEAAWARIEKTIMCGLTPQRINEKGGSNVNKHLAYLALANSATDPWPAFDIDKTIVIHDFETPVEGVFDWIDETDYSITRKNSSVPVPHTDGAGMVLPSVLARNAMFRAPWIKGLLGVFDFRNFILDNGYSPIIQDIYGQSHNVIEEEIQVIFTKSQFKMYRYYDSWDEYKEYFHQYGCSAGLCNMEESRIKKARINYQMLQTLTDITEEELDQLVRPSADKITKLCTCEQTMLEALGVHACNPHMTPFQKALKCYPALLNDTYTKDMLREVKNSLMKKYRSGKLELNSKYTFLLPDFYAACEYWFGHQEHPKGLLADQEVYCRLFPHSPKLDCLRSPHLYREHAVRSNKAPDPNLDKWFVTDALYTSTHDLISKLLQFDVDGDKALVVADPDFIQIAQRNMKHIVPLYYNMKKAAPTKLNNHSIYAGLNAAFTGAPIGTDSNDISKIWNSGVFQSGSFEEQQEALTCIKLLCMENNFHIDYAKTLYKPERPPHIHTLITNYTHSKLPAFFQWAKDKAPSQVEPPNKSLVNRLFEKIPDTPIHTKGIKLGTIDFRLLMSHPQTVCSQEMAQCYDTLNRQYRYLFYRRDENQDNLQYVADTLRYRFSALGYHENTISDMLVEYLYGREKRSKQLLWFCYGQTILHCLEKNLGVKKTKFICCCDCGEWIEVGIRSKSTRCTPCQRQYRSEYQKQLMRTKRQKK